jgi:hypothetical protein
MDDRQNLSQPESVITTTEKSPSRNLQKKTCTASRQIQGEIFSGERSLTTYSVTHAFMVTVPQGTSVGLPHNVQLSRRRTSHGRLKTSW